MTDDRPEPAASRRRVRRTWAQRTVLGFNIVLAVACLVAALAVFVGQKNLEDVKRVDARPGADLVGPTIPLVVETLPPAPGASTSTTSTTPAPTATRRPGGLDAAPANAENFLVTGSDSRACIDRDSPYAGAFLGGPTGGNRPDTIMVLRVEPGTGRAAILSFPRDLWVPVAGTSRKAKINSTFDKTDPSRLVATIESYFGIPIDHYVNIDFCVFKDLVDAVGGVSVPFVTPVRDKNTGLLVKEAGCYTFKGDHALAYVRSRHIQYKGKDNLWHAEGTADIGRIRRQQDFIRRVMQEVRSKGVLDLGFVKRLVDSFQARVVVDLDLTANDVLRLASAMRNLDPATTRSFIIEGSITMRGNASVIAPNLSSERMQLILAIFRGEAGVSSAPAEQTDPITGESAETAGSSSTDPSATTIDRDVLPRDDDGGAEPTTTLATVADNIDTAYGGGKTVVPDRNTVCP
jgi:LCP family protein required for cell wall assembly